VEQKAYVNPYGTYPRSFVCGDGCANKNIPCNGICDAPEDIVIWSNQDYLCGEKCIDRWEARDRKVCDGICVKKTDVCTGVEEEIEGFEEKKDCPGMEEDCSKCTESTPFKCGNDMQCVSVSELCNGERDCPNNEDEEGCCGPFMNKDCTGCSDPSKVKCKNENKCYEKSQLCDGVKDCADNSDEACMDSEGDKCGKMYLCGENILCYNKLCIPNNGTSPWCNTGKVCNGQCIPDEEPCDGKCEEPYKFCEDACVLDHHQCPKGVCKDKNQYPCRNTRECLDKSRFCDRRDDCRDGSDEDDVTCACPGMINCEICQPYHTFKCKDGKQCIRMSDTFNGRKDCNDGSDEEGFDKDTCPGLWNCYNHDNTLNSTLCRNKACRGTCAYEGTEREQWHCRSRCFWRDEQQNCNGECIGIDEICNNGNATCLNYEGFPRREKFPCRAENKCIDNNKPCGGECVDFLDKCGDKCVSPYGDERDCDGKCIPKSEPCNNECIPPRV